MKFKQYNETLTANTHEQFIAIQKGFDLYKHGEISIEAWPSVYHPGPKSSTLFMLKNLPKIKNSKILEIGCGAGMIGLSLAKENNVYMGDINPVAVDCASYNAMLNNIDIKVEKSDLFAAFAGQKFDVILFNTPYWHKDIEDDLEILACDPKGDIFSKFISEAESHLNKNGYAIFTYSNLSDENTFHQALQKTPFSYKVIGREQSDNTKVIRWLIKIKIK